MTEIRCRSCNKLLGKVNIKTNHGDFDITIKCPRCRHEDKYKIIICIEDHESQE